MNLKGLHKGVRFGVRYDFDQDILDPRNGPQLAVELERLKQSVRVWADDPAGLEAMFNDSVKEVREEFAKIDPRLRIRYASVIAPLPEKAPEAEN